ncbi:MAG: hypothetical protein PVJ75_03055 [Chloroflexota bacterium]
MYAILGDELIHFRFDDKQAELQVGLLFRDWPRLFEQFPSAGYLIPGRRPLTLDILKVDRLELVPESSRSVFADHNSQTTVFQSESFWYICFGLDAAARIPLQPDVDTDTPIRVQVTHMSLSTGRLEDIVFSSLAPALRRRGLFMIHAFAIEKDEGAILLVGESGSGKTTTGLSLISHGWRYLANDVLLLRENGGIVSAMPTPGGIGLNAHSLQLLPGLGSTASFKHTTAKYYYPATELVAGWGRGAPVRRILFTQVRPDGETGLEPTNHSVTLARLMEASVDRWDTASLDDHLHTLALLSRQAEGYELSVGRDLERLPSLLSRSPGSGPI